MVHLQYGYDRASNRTYRRDEVARSYGKSFDELYEYDELNQLKKFHRGLLVDGNTVVENPGLQQAWQFDATGNWSNFTTFDPADATKTLDQQLSLPKMPSRQSERYIPVIMADAKVDGIDDEPTIVVAMTTSER